MRSPHRTTITSARALSREPVKIRPFFIIFIEETISFSPFPFPNSLVSIMCSLLSPLLSSGPQEGVCALCLL